VLVTSLSQLSDVHYHASRRPDFLDTPANTAALAGEAAFRLRDLQQPSSLSDPYLVAVPAAVHSSSFGSDAVPGTPTCQSAGCGVVQGLVNGNLCPVCKAAKQRISKKSMRRLARRGGTTHIEGLVYPPAPGTSLGLTALTPSPSEDGRQKKLEKNAKERASRARRLAALRQRAKAEEEKVRRWAAEAEKERLEEARRCELFAGQHSLHRAVSAVVDLCAVSAPQQRVDRWKHLIIDQQSIAYREQQSLDDNQVAGLKRKLDSVKQYFKSAATGLYRIGHNAGLAENKRRVNTLHVQVGALTNKLRRHGFSAQLLENKQLNRGAALQRAAFMRVAFSEPSA